MACFALGDEPADWPACEADATPCSRAPVSPRAPLIALFARATAAARALAAAVVVVLALEAIGCSRAERWLPWLELWLDALLGGAAEAAKATALLTCCVAVGVRRTAAPAPSPAASAVLLESSKAKKTPAKIAASNGRQVSPSDPSDRLILLMACCCILTLNPRSLNPRRLAPAPGAGMSTGGCQPGRRSS